MSEYEKLLKEATPRPWTMTGGEFGEAHLKGPDERLVAEFYKPHDDLLAKHSTEVLPQALEALKLVLLFHSGSHWDFEKQQAWANGLTALLGSAASRDCKVVGANGDGTWDGATPTNEATTKNLCNAVRFAIAAIENVK